MSTLNNICAALLLLASWAGSAHAAIEPGGSPDDIATAITNPDEYAWRLFMFLNRPATPGTAGVADDSKRFGDVANQVSMVWETWALASGGSASEVYKPDGSHPAKWDDLNRTSRQFILDANLERAMVLQEKKLVHSLFFPLNPDDQEVRMNRSTFEFITSNEMYNRDGLEALQVKGAQQRNRDLIQFPGASKELKAMWEKIADAQKPRYLWREVTNTDGTKQAYGLVALHVITKDLPTWFWADFGHIDCESRQNACNIDGQEAALTDPRDSTTRGPNGQAGPAGKDGVRKEAVGTVWENYILRGTQTSFVTADGQ